jgi:uncharacterized protein YecT (DUF1311 family)
VKRRIGKFNVGLYRASCGKFLPLYLVPVGAYLLTFVVYCTAMEFRIVFNPDERINTIVAEGRIVEGDALRLESVILKADRDNYGNIPIYLNSPGGSVAAAFAMVEVMNREEFSAFVSSNAICASACASIVFISARFHEVIGTGLLGIHSCYTKNTNTGDPEPDSFCNRIIAENAINHGTSYSAVDMWQKSYGPETMAWIGKETACQYGLCGPPGFDNTPAVPSFDCRTVSRPSERAICSSKRLARHEASLSKYYFETIQSLPSQEKETFRDEQRAWLRYRDTCQGTAVEACLLDRMIARQQEILDKRSKHHLR